MTHIDLDPFSAQRGIDLDKLKVRYPALYKTAAKNAGQTTGIHNVNFDLFPAVSHKYLLECAVPLSVEPQINMEELQREELAAIQKAADDAAGRNRLEQYAREQGLEDTQANATAIRRWLDENVKGYVSEQGIDLAVQWLGPRGKNMLTWRKPEAAAPPPPAPEPAEVLGILKDGSRQLSLDETPSKHHTTEQLKDYLKRVNAGRILRPSGGFGSKFI